jgi:hypothetical protein
MYRISLHVQTSHSYDCESDLNSIIKFCLKSNITHILISDHDTIEGALKLKKIAIPCGINVIIGEEITTAEGIHIIGVNLKKHINKLPAADVINEILNQNGILYFPHPTRKDGIFKINNWESLLEKKSFLIEIYNNKLSSDFNIKMAEVVNFNMSKINSKFIKVEGTDAHYISDISSTILLVEKDKFNFSSSIESFDGEFYRGKKNTRIIIRLYYYLNIDKLMPVFLKRILKKWYIYFLG